MKFDDIIKTIEEAYLTRTHNEHDRGYIKYFKNPDEDEWKYLLNCRSMNKVGALRAFWVKSKDMLLVWDEYYEQHSYASEVFEINNYSPDNKHIYIMKRSMSEDEPKFGIPELMQSVGGKEFLESEYGSLVDRILKLSYKYK